MSSEPAQLPVTVAPDPGEAIDGYLERLAAANGMTRPRMARRIRAGSANTTFLTIAPAPELLAHVAALGAVDGAALRAVTLASMPGIDATGLDPARRSTWRTVAARGWPPEHGTALCPPCLAEGGIWRLAWRHPWVTVCARHQVWLLGACPTCRRRFRSHRTPLRPLDADTGTCGNPAGTRGRNCPQPLDDLPEELAPAEALGMQQRIDTALAGRPVLVLGTPVEPNTYLTELRALTVLLLHLATQTGAENLVGWAHLARADRDRSRGGHGARWGLVPPADRVLRGSALATADTVLRQARLDSAADALHSWTQLTPNRPDGQLGWLADHTTMTPTLTRLVMAATAARRRLATLLDTTPLLGPGDRLPIKGIAQVLPADAYALHLARMLDVTDRTGRLFAALCLARRHTDTRTWGDAAQVLGLPAETGVRTARACSADLLVRPDLLVTALDHVAQELDLVDYRAREKAVRHLAGSSIWYRPWARAHHPGSHAASRVYAITFLWTEYAHGHLDTSPGWQHHPDHRARARFRRYTSRLTPTATDALIDIAERTTQDRRTS